MPGHESAFWTTPTEAFICCSQGHCLSQCSQPEQALGPPSSLITTPWGWTPNFIALCCLEGPALLPALKCTEAAVVCGGPPGSWAAQGAFGSLRHKASSRSPSTATWLRATVLRRWAALCVPNWQRVDRVPMGKRSRCPQGCCHPGSAPCCPLASLAPCPEGTCLSS